MFDEKKFLELGNKAIAQAKKENEIYEKYLFPFAKKIGLNKRSKTFVEAGNKAILWAKEKQKYGLEYDYFGLPNI